MALGHELFARRMNGIREELLNPVGDLSQEFITEPMVLVVQIFRKEHKEPAERKRDRKMGHSLMERLLRPVQTNKGLKCQWGPWMIGRRGIKRFPQYSKEKVPLRFGAALLQYAPHQIHAFADKSEPVRFFAYEGFRGLPQTGNDLGINISVLEGVHTRFPAEDDLDGL